QEDNTQEWLSRLRLFPVEIENYLEGKHVDWYDMVMRTAVRQNYNLSIGGRTNRSRYFWSLGYDNNEGIVLGDNYSVFRSRLNTSCTVTDWLEVGINSQVSARDESSVPANMNGMSTTSPYGSEYDEDGKLKW